LIIIVIMFLAEASCPGTFPTGSQKNNRSEQNSCSGLTTVHWM